MKVKVFSEQLISDTDLDVIKEKFAKKGKTYESIEDRVNAFVADKHVIEIKSHLCPSSLAAEAKIVFVVTYQ